MMKVTAIVGGAVLGLAAFSAQAADDLTVQLKWVSQSQFAGYYVAQDKGFYAAEDLNVTIKPGGPDIAPPQVIAAGGADAIVEWMPAALAARERGVPLVNIAQIFNHSGLQLTCRADSGVRTPADFKGRTLGVWFFGNEYPFLGWMDKLGLATTGGADGVTVLKQGFNVDPLLQRQADCISTMTYNEYWQVIDAGLDADELVVFPYEDQGVATLEDGLYTTDAKLADPAMVDKLARFVRATIKGWDYAVANQKEAVDIVLDNDTGGALNELHQTRQLAAIADLITSDGGTGFLEPAAYQRTVDVLLGGASDPVINAVPEGAWTHDVWKKATGAAMQ